MSTSGPSIGPGIPFGKLVSFGLVQFPGPSTPVQEYDIEWLTSYVSLADSAYPLDLFNIGNAPIKPMQATWVYLCLADPTLTVPIYQQVETQWNAIYTGIRASNVGTLVVEDATKVVRSCQARIQKIPLKLVPGKNSMHYLAEICWTILSDWQ